MLWALAFVGLLLLAGLTLLALTRPSPASSSAPAADLRPRQAGQRGLDWLLDSAVDWQAKQNCYGCHVQSFAVMGAGVGKANRYDINETQSALLADYLAAIQSSEGYLTNGQGGSFGSKVQTVLGGIGLGSYDDQGDGAYGETLVGMADWLVTQQADDGQWVIDNAEAPVQQGNAMMTGGAIVTLVAAQRHEEKSTYASAIATGEKWLRNTPLETTQDIVFTLIGLRAAGAKEHDVDVKRLIDLLRSRQRDNGGWGETTSLDSNGYATGQVLYAYKLADVPIRDESFQRGVLWLLQNQAADGSWQQVNSQQTSGGRSSNFATTMWAAIGLGEVFDVQTERTFLSLIHPDRDALTLPAVCLFYALPLLLIAPLLWRRQGRYWLASRRERRVKGGIQ